MSSLLLTSLGIICPACDHLNAPRAQKCALCGASTVDRLAASTASAAGSPSQAGITTLPDSPAASSPGRRAPLARSSGPREPAGATAPAPKPSPLQRSVLSAHAPKPVPPVLSARPESSPPGLRPSRPAGPPAIPKPLPPSRAVEPIPATELLKKRPSPSGATSTAAPRFVLAVIAGSGKGQRYRLPSGGCWVGRSRGNILFPEDFFLSAHHATMTVREGQLCIRDEASASGVFVSVSGQETIARDALFCAGQHLFRYLGQLQPQARRAVGQPQVYGAPIPSGQPVYGVEEVLVGGRPGRAVITVGPLLTIGQLRCDLSFPRDEDLAGRHCELTPVPQGAILRDLSGALGTFLRIVPGSDRVLNAGDRFRIGQQVLQVEASV